LAEPEGFVRVFADEGAPMARLLDVAMSEAIASQLVPRVRAAIATRPAAAPAGSASALVERLSERELEIRISCKATSTAPRLLATWSCH
jgi:LuxR family maltose regulon positive regulatory protein